MAESNIMDRAVLLQVAVSTFGIKRKLSKSQFQANADKTYLHAQKELLKSDAYKAITKLDGEFGGWLRDTALPGPFKAGIYLLPTELLELVDGRIAEYQVDRAARIEAFIAEYPEKRDDAETALGDCFDASQYPEPEEVRRVFAIEHRYMTFAVPGQLKGLNKEIFDRETAKLKETIASAQEEIQSVLRAGFSELVTHLVDRLSPHATGKQKIFRDSLVGNVKDFFQTFNARNITDDAELAGLVDQARAILEGVDPQTLREHRGVRDTIRTALEEVKENLDQMLVDKPGRKISFEDMQGEAQA